MPADERHERSVPQDEEAFPAGERASRDDESSGRRAGFPGGVESDEGERPGEKPEGGQPGILEDPPRAD